MAADATHTRPPTIDPEPVTASTLLTAEDLAARWQVNTQHVYRLTREGRMPVVELGKYKRYRIAAIEEFEASGGTASADKAVDTGAR